MFIIGSVLICTTVYIGSVWDPSRIRTDVYDVLNKYMIRTDLYYRLYRFRMGSVMDPYQRLRCFKKILDPYSLLVWFIWVPYGIRHGSVQFCRF